MNSQDQNLTGAAEAQLAKRRMPTPITPGMVFYYPEGHGWCRHGILKAEESNGRIVLRDTYWGLGSDTIRYYPDDLDGKIEFAIDLTNARKVGREEFERFREGDRLFIPIGGGSEQCWVSGSAMPDSELVESQHRRWIEEAKVSIDAAKRNLAWREREYSEWKQSLSGASC
jgi:hypothetical protein